MFLMLGEVLHLAAGGEGQPRQPGLGFLAFHQEHVAWVGCSLHDLIQPSFSFLVGVGLPFSIAARLADGPVAGADDAARLLAGVPARRPRHLPAVRRQAAPDYRFTDTLCQIGLGYGFLFLLGFRPRPGQWAAVGVILAGVLGVVRPVAAAGAGLRLGRRRGEAGLARDNGLDRVRRPLEQEHATRRAAFDVLVPEPVPAAEAVRVRAAAGTRC